MQGMKSDEANWVEPLADRYGRMVFGAAYRVLGNTEEAEDVQQEVFLKLLDARRGPESARNWGAYLKVMAINGAADLLRRRARQRWRTLETIENLPAPATQAPDRQAEQNQKAEILRQALASLPAREAAVFSLRTFEEMSYEEIAAQLDLKANQVGVILHRTRARLLALLEPLLALEPRKESTHVSREP